jgi:hypothetical protein
MVVSNNNNQVNIGHHHFYPEYLSDKYLYFGPRVCTSYVFVIIHNAVRNKNFNSLQSTPINPSPLPPRMSKIKTGQQQIFRTHA